MAFWAVKRRLLYGGTVILALALLTGGVFWKFFHRVPTCTDGIKNGDEKGIDCGGSCKFICTNEALNPVVLWSKVFSISGDVYTAVAYVENPNVNSKNNRAKYKFEIYDAGNRLLTIKEGETDVPKNKKFAIFEAGIVLKSAKPKSADFKFTSFDKWEKDTAKDLDVSIGHSSLLLASTSPRVEGSVTNNSLYNISTLELTVFVSDSRENVIAASRTFVDNLSSRQTENFVFTWPKPFDSEASVVNVIYRPI